MKNLKKMMFGLAALVLAFGLVFSVSAFQEKEAKIQTAWFLLNETTGALDPSNTQVNPDELCEESGEKYCAGEYEVIGGIPVAATATPERMKN